MSSSTFDTLLQPYANYPAPIRPYLLKADTNPTLRSLFTKSGMAVLLDILGRAPIHTPNRPIKLRVDSVATKLSRSEKTVQRVLNLLQNKGWLLRSADHDGRNYRGQFSHREFLVVGELRQMLGLPNADYRQTIMSDGHSQTTETPSTSPVLPTIFVDNSISETIMSDGHIGVNKFFRKEDLKEASFNKSENPKKPKAEGKLPDNLIALQTDLDLSKGGICALMKLAAQHKQRLQDIWSAKKEIILKSGAKQGRAFNYLKSLILANEDFAYVAQQQSRLQVTAQINQRVTDRKVFWYRRYSGSNGIIVRLFDGTAEVVRSSSDIRFVPAAGMQSIYEAIETGKLREIPE